MEEIIVLSHGSDHVICILFLGFSQVATYFFSFPNDISLGSTYSIIKLIVLPEAWAIVMIPAAISSTIAIPKCSYFIVWMATLV